MSPSAFSRKQLPPRAPAWRVAAALQKGCAVVARGSSCARHSPSGPADPMQGGDDLSTTAEPSMCGRTGLRGPAVVALAALCAAVLPTSAQQAAEKAEAAPPPPHRTVAPRERALPPVRADEGMWRWLRDQARRVRTLDGGPVAFAMR